jgi:endonuclease/exonuclease/phosphatase family metal-dependent hydrolase
VNDIRRIDIAVANFRNGGMRRGIAPDLSASRGYDLHRLTRLFAPARPRPPAVIALCEPKEWDSHGKAVGLAAANALAVALGRPYVVEFGHLDRGPAGPAVLYDPTTLRLDYFGDTHPTVWADSRNLARFHHVQDPTAKLLVKVVHWDHSDGDLRLSQAKRDSTLAESPEPTVLAGDLNSTASGPHLPQRDWGLLPPARRGQKSMVVDGVRVADTRAVDHLIGSWTPGGRRSGVGFHAACEVAHFRDGMPAARAFAPTLAPGVDAPAEPIVNDWALLNAAAVSLLVPDSYAVHASNGDASDHELITFSLAL